MAETADPLCPGDMSQIKHILQSSLLAAHKTTIGGQALIEGLLMIGPVKRAMAVRQADGSIHEEELAPVRLSLAAKIPFVRGSVRLFRQLVSGTKALLRSAELADDSSTPDDEPPVDNATGDQPVKRPSLIQKAGAALDAWLTRHSDVMLYVSASLGILFSVMLFILLPNALTSLIGRFSGLTAENGRQEAILFNLIEGLIRITIFVGYLALTSRIKDIRRVWMYHGAEHKTIACYEAGETLTVEHAGKYSRFHPRCGTAFLFIVILVSIIVFSLVGWRGFWLNLLIRFALVPVVAGIAYEILRLAGRYDNRLTRAVSAPGLWLQRFTTAEPDDGMLEVAITAMNAVRPDSEQSDAW